MRYIPITALFLTTFLAFACSTSKPAPRPQPGPKPPVAVQPAPAQERPELPIKDGITNIHWIDSEYLMPVLEDAQRVNKPVFVVFYASWCAPCKVMEEEIFTQNGVSDFYNSHFINFHTDFDSETGKTIAQIYEVDKLPTILYLNPKGIVLERHTGMASAAELLRLGKLVSLK